MVPCHWPRSGCPSQVARRLRRFAFLMTSVSHNFSLFAAHLGILTIIVLDATYLFGTTVCITHWQA